MFETGQGCETLRWSGSLQFFLLAKYDDCETKLQSSENAVIKPNTSIGRIKIRFYWTKADLKYVKLNLDKTYFK